MHIFTFPLKAKFGGKSAEHAYQIKKTTQSFDAVMVWRNNRPATCDHQSSIKTQGKQKLLGRKHIWLEDDFIRVKINVGNFQLGFFFLL